jgi:hypothetical protein
VVTAEMRIDDLRRLGPRALQALHDLGVQAGHADLTIREAAAHARLEIDDVLALLNRLVSDGVGPGA